MERFRYINYARYARVVTIDVDTTVKYLFYNKIILA